MALVVRVDVDRPYGRQPLVRHLLSRFASDFYLPKLPLCGYLRELEVLLDLLRERDARAHIFFRRCTLPGPALIQRMRREGHCLGLHLENSRTYETFAAEKAILERHLGQEVLAVSKHGSGGRKYGWHHYPPYEAEKYVTWIRKSRMRLFLGNLENPALLPIHDGNGLQVFPSAFWLEPDWRDTQAFPISWLTVEAKRRDVVLLIHPENVLASPALVEDMSELLRAVETCVLISDTAVA